MSISTDDISSDCFCPCSSEARPQGDLEGWRKDLRRRFIPCRDSGVEFLRKYVPSRVPSPPPGDVANALAKFAQWESVKGEKAGSYYPCLLEGLDALVSSFPAEKRPSFMNCDKYAQRFPFSALAKKYHSMPPDIAMSFPGQTFDGSKSPDWFAFSAIVQANSEDKADPFKKRHRKHCKALVQLAVGAHNLIHAHGLLCVSVLGIYGDTMRICRFDHSGAVICPPLSLKNIEDLKVIQQFFWNFVNPIEDVPFVGWDLTVRLLENADEQWLLARLGRANVDTTDVILREARSVQVPDGERQGSCGTHTYIAFRVLNVNTRLFSRATSVWHGIRDTRRRIDGRVVADPAPSVDDLRLHIIKEAWRPLARRPEKDFYDRLDSVIPPYERVGLPTLVRGSDLGEVEVRLWESALYGAPAPVTLDCAHHKTRLSVPASQPVSTPSPSWLSASGGPSNEPVHRPMQQTFTWRQARGARCWRRERSHVRFVVREVGRLVTQFRNTKELVMAFRDAIIGHRTAMAKGGILHRDISVGNILIVDDPALQDQFCGFMHDFDYSFMSRDAPHEDLLSLSAADLESLLLAHDSNGDLKKRTGTLLFMAIDLLISEGNPIVHAIHHDLESFFWALLWVVLRHTNNRLVNRVKNTDRHSTYARAFRRDNTDLARMAKIDWLCTGAKHLEVVNNSPITDLMRNFALLVDNRVPGKSLNYDCVLYLFDTALASRSWPDADNDGPLDFVSPDTRTTSTSDCRSRHDRKRARARKRIERACEARTGQEPGDNDADTDDDGYDEPWESDDEDEPYPATCLGDADYDEDELDDERSDVERYEHLSVTASEGDDWQDAADVSALLSHGDVEVEDANGSALSRDLFQGLTLSN